MNFIYYIKHKCYTFGMLMHGRSEGLRDQRHLFNGMEADAEVSGEGNSYTTQFRQYDPRLGRWKSLDALARKAPGWTPYRAFFNNPILYTDYTGLFEDRKSARKYRREHDDVNGKIRKNDDGTFSIEGETTSYFAGNDKGFHGDEHKNDGVMELARATPKDYSVTLVVTREIETTEEPAWVWYKPWTWGDINLKGNAKWSFGIEFIGAPLEEGPSNVSIAEKDAWTVKIQYDDFADLQDLAGALKKC